MTVRVSVLYQRDMTHFVSDDDYRTGCRNVSHSQQQPYSRLRSSGRSYSTYLRRPSVLDCPW